MGKRQDQFERLALPHLRGLLRFARRLTNDSPDAEDFVQQTLLQAWKAFHQFREGTNERAWLFRILLNAIRARSVVRTVPLSLEIREQAPFSEALDISDALKRLSAEHRMVLLLGVVEGFTCREIAGLLDIPIGTVMSRLSLARQALREQLTMEPRGRLIEL